MNKDKPDCDQCGVEVTIVDHPSCGGKGGEEKGK